MSPELVHDLQHYSLPYFGININVLVGLLAVSGGNTEDALTVVCGTDILVDNSA